MAATALETALDFYFEKSRIVPKPSRIKRGQESQPVKDNRYRFAFFSRNHHLESSPP
jgi:hypothetical protein